MYIPPLDYPPCIPTIQYFVVINASTGAFALLADFSRRSAKPSLVPGDSRTYARRLFPGKKDLLINHVYAIVGDAPRVCAYIRIACEGAIRWFANARLSLRETLRERSFIFIFSTNSRGEKILHENVIE